MNNNLLRATAAPVPPIEFVGGYTVEHTSTSTSASFSLTSLTGGVSAAPDVGDIVVVLVATATGGTASTVAVDSAGYTTITYQLQSSDSNDITLSAYYKVLSSAETSVSVSPKGSSGDGSVVIVHVWRNVSALAGVATATGINTANANPPSVTPTVAGSEIITMGAASPYNSGTSYTAGYLSHFVQLTADSAKRSIGGMGSVSWSSGAYDPAAWTISTDDTRNPWAAVTLILEPL